MSVQIPSTSKPLDEVGEFGLIAGIRNILRASKETSTGAIGEIGDDAALWRPRPGWTAVITTDMLIEGVHFRHDWSKADSIGHRALAVNLSDLAAMSARPRVAVVALGLCGDETDRWVYDFYHSALKLGKRLHFKIVGGDIVRSPEHTTVSVTLLGEIPPNCQPLSRDRAQDGDVIAVTGPLGLAAGGVRILTDMNLQLEGSPRMLDAFRRPDPRIVQGMLLSHAGVKCGMDLSDGLLGDLPKICESSGFSATLYQDSLPIPHAVRWGFDDWLDLALRGGEDFELLFTCPPDVFERVQHLFARYRCPPPIEIGVISLPKDKTPVIELLRTDRKRETLESGAWDHFAGGSDRRR